MKIVDISKLEKDVQAGQKALAEISMAIHSIQEALNEYENETGENDNKPPF
jgi:conjugal transfer/entry exclusion protein